jgi:hypothetical protein
MVLCDLELSPNQVWGLGGDGKPLDYDELERWNRVGCERGIGSRKGER